MQLAYVVCVLEPHSQKYLCCKVNRGELITLIRRALKAVYVMPSAQSVSSQTWLAANEGRANTKVTNLVAVGKRDDFLFHSSSFHLCRTNATVMNWLELKW